MRSRIGAQVPRNSRSAKPDERAVACRWKMEACSALARSRRPRRPSVSSTACRSNAERLITFSTSEVAVCCCSASERSRVRACTSSNRRTFSIAMTAWSAKVLTSSICRSVNGPGVGRPKTKTPITLSFAQQRDREVRAVAAQALGLAEQIIRILENVGDMRDFSGARGAPGAGSGTGSQRVFKKVTFERLAVPLLHRQPEDVAVKKLDQAHGRFAERTRRLDQCVATPPANRTPSG